MESSSTQIRIVLLIASLALGIVILTGNVRYTQGDSRYFLLTSQALLEHGTIRLDTYDEELDLTALVNGKDWMLERFQSTGHVYNYYPVGTAMFAMPFVWIGKRLGMDMTVPDHDEAMQMAIAAILCISIFLLLFRLARAYVDEWQAMLLALVFSFGTSLLSTLGTALWSQNFQTFFILLALLEIVEVERGKRENIRPYWLGGLLFATWLCRPTSAVFILMVFVWVTLRHRRSLLKLVATSAVLMILFLLWSKLEYNRFLPGYFNPAQWPWKGSFLESWASLWLSPARGLLWFSPIVWFAFAGWFRRDVRSQLLWLALWGWVLVHTVMAARSAMPWGGWCFGPRFFTELMPAFALLILIGNEKNGSILPARTNMKTAAMSVFALLSVSINTLQGIYNPETQKWNDGPNIDQHWSERMWEFSNPQFLATESRNELRAYEATLEVEVGRAIHDRLPEGTVMVVGNPSPETRFITKKWRRSDKFSGRIIVNSVPAALRENPTGFYVHPSAQPFIPEPDKYHIEPVSSGMNLGEFIRKHSAQSDREVLLSAKDEASLKLSEATRSIFRQMGSEIDSLKYRDSYIAAVFDGKFVMEEMGLRDLTTSFPGNNLLQAPAIYLRSAGMENGNFSEIRLGSMNYSQNERGMNVVVITLPERRVVASTSFDTHVADQERAWFFRYTLKK